MTNTYQSPPPGSPPEHERPRDDEPQTAAGVAAPEAPPRDTGTESPSPAESHEHMSPTIDAEQERLVWTPPLPQYPPRPTRQQEPVQYQAPRPQPAPQYAPQTYVPPQPAPTPAPVHAPQQAHAPAPHQAYAPAIAGGYSAPVSPYATQPQTVITMPPPHVSKVRLSRRMARRMVMGADAARIAMFGVRPVLAVFFVIFLLLSGWLAYDKWLAGSGSSATPNGGKGSAVTLPPETPAVQAYLTSVQKGDADGVWNSLGAQEKAKRISSGADKSVLTAVLQAEKQNGFMYTGYHYLAAYGMNGSSDPSKGGIYFYVADVGSGTQHTSVPMIFQMDDKGQISDVSDQLYQFVLQQLKGN